VALAGMAALVSLPWPSGWPDWAVLGLAVLVTVPVTGLVGSYVFAGYVALSRLPTVQGWQLSAQALEDVKGFVRLRLDPDGRLTLYPIVVDTVCHDWSLDPDGLDGRPGSVRPEFVGGPPRPHLIEPPIVIEREPVVTAREPVTEPATARPDTEPASQPASQPATTS
jgi:hypothetical protein